MTRDGRLSVRHPSQWQVTVLLVWSIATFVLCLVQIPAVVAFFAYRLK